MMRVFVSYAHEDIEIAKKLYYELKKNSVSAWLDKESIMPGKIWRIEIEKAIKNSEYFLALISINSVNKVGYIQKELKTAIEILGLMPPNAIFLIPVRLDNSLPSHSILNDIQWVDLFESYETGFKKILEVIKKPKQSLKGQWRDPSDGDIVYFQECNDRVIGFYDFGKNRKTGLYIGKLVNKTFEYKWRWLEENYSGRGRMTLSNDGKVLTGHWWFGEKEYNVREVQYIYISEVMPKWLSMNDFKQFQKYADS